MAYPGIIGVFVNLLQPVFPYTFDPLFTPLLGVGTASTGAWITIIAVSVVLSALISFLYYLLMDVERYRELKEEREEMNQKMKEARDDGEVDASKQQMSEMMELQKEFFMLMMKPMLASMLIFFFLLPWMYVTFAPIIPVTAAGNGYTGELTFNGHQVPFTVENRTDSLVLMTGGETYSEGDTVAMNGLDWKISNIQLEEDPSVSMNAVIWYAPISLPLTGDDIGWLGTYILISIPATFLFRKLLGIQ